METLIAELTARVGLDRATAEKIVEYLKANAHRLPELLQSDAAKGVMEKRTVMRLDPRLSPVKAAVLPLSRNEDLSPKARALAALLRQRWNVEFDDAGAIGRRYRRQDEIGTPFCITVDFETLDDDKVTIRSRDTMGQDRVSLDAVERYLLDHLPPC